MRIRNTRKETIEKRYRRLKAHYAENPPKNATAFRFAVIRCSFQAGLTDAQTAEILDTSEDVIRFEIDIAIQDAQ